MRKLYRRDEGFRNLPHMNNYTHVKIKWLRKYLNLKHVRYPWNVIKMFTNRKELVLEVGTY